MRRAIAIDFDGCLCENRWPEIGAPHMDVINAALAEQENGAALILWTCRCGVQLKEAVDWCAGYGLKFDAVNANLPERITAFSNDCRKLNADEYWDDRAVRKPDLSNEALTVADLLDMGKDWVWIKLYFHQRNNSISQPLGCQILQRGSPSHLSEVDVPQGQGELS